MKVVIGKYRSGLRPFTRLHSWYVEKRFDKPKWVVKDDQYNMIDRAVERVCDALQSVVHATINRPIIWKMKDQRIKVHIDPWDTWNLDHTLALVIHPALVRLKETMHGSQLVDAEDVPEHLRPEPEQASAGLYGDNRVHERWEWVLGEMIWAFEQCTKPDHGTDQFYSGKAKISFKPVEGTDLSQMVEDSDSTFKVDVDGRDAHIKRVRNGLRLFGKYYLGLWD